MDAEQRFIMMLALIAIILLAIVGLVLLIVLWQYREMIALLLLTLIVLVLLLVVGLGTNEAILRHRRVKYKSELPLDTRGQPFYVPAEMKVYQGNDPRDE